MRPQLVPVDRARHNSMTTDGRRKSSSHETMHLTFNANLPVRKAVSGPPPSTTALARRGTSAPAGTTQAKLSVLLGATAPTYLGPKTGPPEREP